jgi:polar amino acid transport system substrate-binding protein
LKKDGTLAKIHETWFGTKPDEGLATSTVMDMPKL